MVLAVAIIPLTRVVVIADDLWRMGSCVQVQSQADKLHVQGLHQFNRAGKQLLRLGVLCKLLELLT